MNCTHEQLNKRLLVLMQMGAYLQSESGHIWIECTEESRLYELLEKEGVSLNNKIYGGILEALDTIDETLRLAGHPSLLDSYSPEVSFFGQCGIASNRIDKREKGKGGIF